MLFLRLRHLGLRFARSMATASVSATAGSATGKVGGLRAFFKKEVTMPFPVFLFGVFAGNNLLQDYLGTGDNFFYGSFQTDKDPEDIAEFYQAEDLLKIIAIHPFFFKLFMDKVVTGDSPESEEDALLSLDESRMVVRTLGMEASFEIIEHEEDVNGVVKKISFQRHERFVDYIPFLADWGFKTVLWDQTWLYGFRLLEDGKVEIYHKGERFYGPWPIRIIVFFHQNYVLWACRRYLTSEAFGSSEDADFDRREEQLACMPLDAFKDMVRRLRRDKERTLEALQNDRYADAAEVAETKQLLKSLSSMETLEKSPIAVAKRPMMGSVKKMQSLTPGQNETDEATKLVVSDAETREVLTAIRKDGPTNKAVSAAMTQALERTKTVEFKQRLRHKSLYRSDTIQTGLPDDAAKNNSGA